MKIPVGILSITHVQKETQRGQDDVGLLRDAVVGQGWEVVVEDAVGDDKLAIQQKIHLLLEHDCQLVLIRGGIGLGLRDVVPDAVREMASKELPAFGEAMRARTSNQPCAGLCDRSLAAVVDRALVVCLPKNGLEAVASLGAVTQGIPAVVKNVVSASE